MTDYSKVRDLGQLSSKEFGIAVPKKEAITIIREFGASEARDFSADGRVRDITLKSDPRFADYKISELESVLLMHAGRHHDVMEFVTRQLSLRTYPSNQPNQPT